MKVISRIYKLKIIDSEEKKTGIERVGWTRDSIFHMKLIVILSCKIIYGFLVTQQ